ncbi:protein-lysine N-methyltransferase EEF2KMT isoform X1 [Amblyomma americanum]
MPDETLKQLSKRFLACVPIAELKNLLDTVPGVCFVEEFQEQLVACTVQHPVARTFPPRASYVKHFLKCVIDKLDAHNVDIADSLYVHFAEKLGFRNSGDDLPGFVTYTIDDRTAVTLKEHTAVVLNGTTGLRTWQASMFLSEWCLENRNLLSGKHILELGCGVGLTGIVICKTCSPLTYTFTDGHCAVLQSVEENLGRNDVTGSNISVHMLSWGDHTDYKEHCATDIILGADLVFDPAVIPLLVGTLGDLLAEGGTAYIASTVRNPETHALFLSSLADKASLHHESCAPPQENIFFYDRSSPIEIDKIVAQER